MTPCTNFSASSFLPRGVHLPTHQRPSREAKKGRAHALDMEANPFHWSDYLNAEGMADVAPSGTSLHGGQSGLGG